MALEWQQQSVSHTVTLPREGFIGWVDQVMYKLFGRKPKLEHRTYTFSVWVKGNGATLQISGPREERY